jgi:hypothetical protein
MNNRTLSAVTLGAFLIALAVGIIAWVAMDSALTMILWVTLLIFGIALFALSFLYPKGSGKFGPSEFIYRMVAGIIIAAIGLIGILFTETEISIWILAAIFLIVLAVVGITVALMNGKEGK